MATLKECEERFVKSYLDHEGTYRRNLEGQQQELLRQARARQAKSGARNEPPAAFSFDWKELEKADPIPELVKLHREIWKVLGGQTWHILGHEDPLIEAITTLADEIERRVANMVAISVPGLCKQIRLFYEVSQDGIDLDDTFRSHPSFIRSICASIDALTERKTGDEGGPPPA